MSYWNETGKYQKAYNYLYNKLVPRSGVARSKYGELLRKISYVYYRRHNDGDTYEDLIYDYDYDRSSPIFHNNEGMPEKEREFVENLLSGYGNYDKILEDTVNYSMVRIMLFLSTKNKVYNPDTNRLVFITSSTGQVALNKLDCNVKHLHLFDVGEDLDLKTKFKRAVKYNPGDKKCVGDDFDFKEYFTYFTRRNLGHMNGAMYTNLQKSHLITINKLMKTTKSFEFSEELTMMNDLVKCLRKCFKNNRFITNLKDESPDDYEAKYKKLKAIKDAHDKDYMGHVRHLVNAMNDRQKKYTM